MPETTLSSAATQTWNAQYMTPVLYIYLSVSNKKRIYFLIATQIEVVLRNIVTNTVTNYTTSESVRMSKIS